MDLGQDLSTLSDQQIKSIVDKLSEKNLAQLRTWQDLTALQIGRAFEAKNTFALNNLRIKEQILSATIDTKEVK